MEKLKERKKQWVRRPAPKYRSIVAILDVAYHYEYPKNMETCIWGIPAKYKKFPNREIVALTCMWLYDYTPKSLIGVKKVISWFKNNPYSFIMNKEYNYLMMECNQNEIIYGNINIKDCYYFFEWLYNILNLYGSFRNALLLSGITQPDEAVYNQIKALNGFNEKTTKTEAKINLFLFMMVHCYNDYNYDSSSLKPPLFNSVIIPNCKSLGLLSKKEKPDKYISKVTEYLKWFSEDHPMTFWVGVAMYRDYLRKFHNISKKFSSKTPVKHRFKKR